MIVNLLIQATAACFLLTAVYLIVCLVQLVREQNNYKSKPRRRYTKPSSPRRRVNLVLEKQLLTMVAGNRQLAERLVDLARAGQPQRSEDWYWEKAIYDLERDRH
jgi:hypothetical protein